ncbi:hypothetical protein TcWFU_008231 [Taenia crassiceps]|uniref:Uncharacterized protein n=1 Tax=Taenia crassiceps TaxID=6207 RepID=A0ABR4Q1J1_9CEST
MTVGILYFTHGKALDTAKRSPLWSETHSSPQRDSSLLFDVQEEGRLRSPVVTSAKKKVVHSSGPSEREGR